ncbi:hypothetical protein [Komagataeibacter swingsii]|uniref:Uncharacterized protein n=1 Tax=Komagataeibacter swingsii TaxID=215220 RepID=A0A2V4RLE7_9PROT|nr:hypothetical protein [Komagataeibacter swingsii]PYD70626.1 hypothetical protein CFR76_04565 [Komagataeibacter swingsii]GBQ58849.1 hypothetical protein AA16373_1383 [Komagataeibacter swingsii DSM 16373]
MTTHALAGLGLFLTGAAFSQVLAFGVAAWRLARRRRRIVETLGPPAPDPPDRESLPLRHRVDHQETSGEAFIHQ